MEIKASDVKNLREKTGAGMMDCKKALVEANGDFALAERKLKEWGLAGVAKRAGRATNEGRIFIAENKKSTALIYISCETDFVCRNEDFIKGGARMAEMALANKYAAPNAELEAVVQDMASVIRENMSLKQAAFMEAAADEILHSYTHGEGKLVVVVKFKASNPAAFDKPEVSAFIHDTALHIAAFRPTFLSEAAISADWIREQEDIFKKQVEGDEKMKGKPEKVIQGILAGKLKKLYSEVCLLDQGFVKDEKQSVQAVMQAVAKAAGTELSIADYRYIKVGEEA